MLEFLPIDQEPTPHQPQDLPSLQRVADTGYGGVVSLTNNTDP